MSGHLHLFDATSLALDSSQSPVTYTKSPNTWSLPSMVLCHRPHLSQFSLLFSMTHWAPATVASFYFRQNAKPTPTWGLWTSVCSAWNEPLLHCPNLHQARHSSGATPRQCSLTGACPLLCLLEIIPIKSLLIVFVFYFWSVLCFQDYLLSFLTREEASQERHDCLSHCCVPRAWDGPPPECGGGKEHALIFCMLVSLGPGPGPVPRTESPEQILSCGSMLYREGSALLRTSVGC